MLQSAKELLTQLGYPQEPAWLLAAMQEIHRKLGTFTPETAQLLRSHFRADEAQWNSLLPLFPVKIDAPHTLKVCRGAVCGRQIDTSLLEQEKLAIIETCCTGNCHQAPVAKLDETLITEASIEKIRALIAQRIGN